MNPYISIWFNTRKTIEEKLKSEWVEDYGIIPYFIFGINGSLTGNLRTDLLDFGINPIINFAFVIALGFVVGLFFRTVWINVIYYLGKIWRGAASKREIDLGVSLSLIPQGITFIYLVITLVIFQGDISLLSENNVLSLIIYFFGFKILIIGISRVQKVSYGIAIINIFIPQFLIGMIYLLFQGGY